MIGRYQFSQHPNLVKSIGETEMDFDSHPSPSKSSWDALKGPFPSKSSWNALKGPFPSKSSWDALKGPFPLMSLISNIFLLERLFLRKVRSCKNKKKKRSCTKKNINKLDRQVTWSILYYDLRPISTLVITFDHRN